MKKRYADGGIYTADMGQPPMEPDGGSAPPKLPMAKKKKAMPPKRPKAPAEAGAGDVTPPKEMMGYKKGGSVSSRADGIAKRGKTNCKMV